MSDLVPEPGEKRTAGVDWMRWLRLAMVVGVLLLGVAWTFRALWGEDLTRTTPINNSAPYAALSVDHGAARATMGTDQRFVIWLFARNARTWLTRPSAMFDAEICHPESQSLTLGEPGFSMGLIATPAWLVSGDPVFIYNFVVMALPLIAGLAMFLLIRDWTGQTGAALAAAILYAFHVVNIGDVVHPYVTDTTWTVLALLFLRRWLELGRWRDVLGLAAAVALQIGGSLYALIGAAILGALVAAYALFALGLQKTRPAHWGVLLAAIALALYGAFGPYLAKADSGTLSDVSIRIFMPWSALVPGRDGFPGWVMLALVLGAFLPIVRSNEEVRWNPRWALLAAVVICFVLASGGNAGDRLMDQLRGQEPSAALPNPYLWLASFVPGLALIRAPVWVAACAHMGLCILAGLGAARWLRRVPPPRAVLASILLVVVAFAFTLRPGLADSHGFLTLPARPPEHMIEFFRVLEENGDRGPLMELPVDHLGPRYGTLSILMSAYHDRRTSRCYNSFVSDEVREAWQLASGLPDPGVARALYDLGFRTVIIHHPPARKRMLALVAEIDALGSAAGSPLELLHRNPVTSAYRIVLEERAEERTDESTKGRGGEPVE